MTTPSRQSVWIDDALRWLWHHDNDALTRAEEVRGDIIEDEGEFQEYMLEHEMDLVDETAERLKIEHVKNSNE